MSQGKVVRGGVEPPTFRFSGVLSLCDHDRVTITRPSSPAYGLVSGIRHDHSCCAAVCHQAPFRLWASTGEPSGAMTCGAFVGLREGTD